MVGTITGMPLLYVWSLYLSLECSTPRQLYIGLQILSSLEFRKVRKICFPLFLCLFTILFNAMFLSDYYSYRHLKLYLATTLKNLISSLSVFLWCLSVQLSSENEFRDSHKSQKCQLSVFLLFVKYLLTMPYKDEAFAVYALLRKYGTISETLWLQCSDRRKWNYRKCELRNRVQNILLNTPNKIAKVETLENRDNTGHVREYGGKKGRKNNLMEHRRLNNEVRRETVNEERPQKKRSSTKYAMKLQSFNRLEDIT